LRGEADIQLVSQEYSEIPLEMSIRCLVRAVKPAAPGTLTPVGRTSRLEPGQLR
jgi:hypothetical protein